MEYPSSGFALTGRRIVTGGGVVDGAVIVRRGSIEAIVPADAVPSGTPCADVGESVVMAGLVDTHVHINAPGRTEWEGFGTATMAAAAGGVTTLVDMPLNSVPATTDCAALEEKVRTAEESVLYVDCGFHGGVVPGNADEVASLARAGVCGFKAFLIDSGVPEFAAVGEGDLRASMSVIAKTGLPLLVHAERLTVRPRAGGPPAVYATYLASRPRAWENDAIDLVLRLGAEYECAVHIVHLSSSDALDALEAARAKGQPVTVETCPHYLFLAAEDIGDGETLAKCAPPVRERANRDRLWDALSRGIIDMIVSDHSPAPPALKHIESGDFMRAWGGIAALQLGLPVVWTAARERNVAVDRMADWMAAEPARLAGLHGRKGDLQPGADADMVIWDPDAAFEVVAEQMLHRHRRTPYEGFKLFGVVEKTFLRGELVYDRGNIVGHPRGQVLRRGYQ